MNITKELKERIKDEVKVIDVGIRYFDDLKKQYEQNSSKPMYMTNCIHDRDKTPSLAFYTNPNENYFYCYGCKAGSSSHDNVKSSDVISLMMWLENLDFQDACKKLIEDYDVNVSDIDLDQQYSKNPLYKIKRKQNISYYYNLDKDEYVEVKDYLLKERGLTREIIDKFRIGAKTEVFQGRSIKVSVYPLINYNGNTIGFSYRYGLDKIKYKNSVNDEILSRGSELYGIYNAKQIKKDYVVLVEGYHDVLSLFKNKIPAVAPMTTSLSDDQIKLLKRLKRMVIFFPDGDKAGLDFLRKSGLKLYENNIDFRIYSSYGLDPDSFCKKVENPEKILLKHSQDFFKFLIDKISDIYESKLLEMNLKLIEDTNKILLNISSDEERYVYQDYINSKIKKSKKGDD